MQADYSAAVYDVVMQQNDTFESQLRATAAGTVVATMTCTVDTDTATVTRAMGTAVTSAIEPGTYVHDMHWIDPDGDVRTLIAGRFTVKADVTRV